MQTKTRKTRHSPGIRGPSEGTKSCVGLREGMQLVERTRGWEPERWAFEFQSPIPHWPHGSQHNRSPALSEAYSVAPAAVAAGPWLGPPVPMPLTECRGWHLLCSVKSEQKWYSKRKLSCSFLLATRTPPPPNQLPPLLLIVDNMEPHPTLCQGLACVRNGTLWL